MIEKGGVVVLGPTGVSYRIPYELRTSRTPVNFDPAAGLFRLYLYILCLQNI